MDMNASDAVPPRAGSAAPLWAHSTPEPDDTPDTPPLPMPDNEPDPAHAPVEDPSLPVAPIRAH